MGARFRRMPPFLNVAASTTAVITNLPRGITYNKMLLTLGGTSFTKAHITEIRLRLGGKTIWTIEGSHCDTINKYNGQSAAATALLLDFTAAEAKTAFGNIIGGIDTSDFNAFAMEVDIGAATAPTLELTADISPPKPAPLNGELDIRPVFRAMVKSTIALTGAAKHGIQLPLGSQQGSSIRQIHLFHSNLTSFEVKKDNDILLDDLAIAKVQAFQNQFGRTTQSGHYAYDPVLRNFQGEAELTNRIGEASQQANWEFFATLSATDILDTYVDMFTDINRI